jgi:hypothetical protein
LPFSAVSSVHFIFFHQILSCVSSVTYISFLYLLIFALYSLLNFLLYFVFSPAVYIFLLTLLHFLFNVLLLTPCCLFKTVLSRARFSQYCCFILLWRFRIQIAFPKTRCPASYLPCNSSCYLLITSTDFPQSVTSVST